MLTEPEIIIVRKGFRALNIDVLSHKLAICFELYKSLCGNCRNWCFMIEIPQSKVLKPRNYAYNFTLATLL